MTVATWPALVNSFAPSVTEAPFATGTRLQVVGRAIFCSCSREVAALPMMCGFAPKSVSSEAILHLKPNLVLAGNRSQKDVVAALEGAGITVFLRAPAALSEIESGIAALGHIIGNDEAAQSVVGSMRARTAAVTAKIRTIPPERRL